MLDFFLEALRRYRMRRNIAKLRRIFVRDGNAVAVEACDLLRAKVDAGDFS